jgi:hypothetical protein
MASDRVFASWIDTAATRFSHAGLDHQASRSLATTVVAALEGGFILARTSRDATVLHSIGRQMFDLVTHRLASRAATAEVGTTTRSG